MSANQKMSAKQKLLRVVVPDKKAHDVAFFFVFYRNLTSWGVKELLKTEGLRLTPAPAGVMRRPSKNRNLQCPV